MKVIVEYVWIDAVGQLRSKARTLNLSCISLDNSTVNVDISKIPQWNFDGSSTGQAIGSDSEVIIVPCALFNDPFRKGPHKIVMCDCYNRNGKPLESNSRYAANILFKTLEAHKPWFGMEQEYVLYDVKTGLPVGWVKETNPEPQGKYYCGVGTGKVFCRDLVDKHYKLCLEAGIELSGINAEVMPGQWEYQVGPCEGISMGDQLWMARYILQRLCEKCGLMPSLDPKPEKGDWNGSGCHTNYSTLKMREKKGYPYILDAIKKLETKHKEHIKVYGDNEKRLTGAHETSSIENFTWAVADRTASVRIPLCVYKEGSGYLEDRRPAANCDPYTVTAKIAATTLLKLN